MKNPLKTYLKKNGLKQIFFAQKIKVSQPLLSGILNERFVPSLMTAFNIEEATNGEVALHDWKLFFLATQELKKKQELKKTKKNNKKTEKTSHEK